MLFICANGLYRSIGGGSSSDRYQLVPDPRSDFSCSSVDLSVCVCAATFSLSTMRRAEVLEAAFSTAKAPLEMSLRLTSVTSDTRQLLPVFTQQQIFHCITLSEAPGETQTSAPRSLIRSTRQARPWPAEDRACQSLRRTSHRPGLKARGPHSASPDRATAPPSLSPRAVRRTLPFGHAPL
jgi:hypothetical protein